MLASEALAEGLDELDLDLGAAAQRLLQDYAALLRDWNRTFNLVSRGDIPRLLERHVLDSLSIWRLIEGERAADIGTGAGFPGIPLAIALPSCRWTLIDRSVRKARFLREVCRRLRLDGVQVLQRDVRDVAAAQVAGAQFDTVVARAYGPAVTAVCSAAPLCRPGGVMLLMSGQPVGLLELQEAGFGHAERLEVWVPILNRTHVVQRFRKSSSGGSSG